MRCESSNEKYGSQDDIHVIFCLYPIHRPAKLENRITKEKKTYFKYEHILSHFLSDIYGYCFGNLGS